MASTFGIEDEHDEAKLIGRDANDEWVLRAILQHSSAWVQTRSLRARARGELLIHRAPGGALLSAMLPTMALDRPLQYEMGDAGVVKVWAKGAASDFL